MDTTSQLEALREKVKELEERIERLEHNDHLTDKAMEGVYHSFNRRLRKLEEKD